MCIYLHSYQTSSFLSQKNKFSKYAFGISTSKTNSVNCLLTSCHLQPHPFYQWIRVSRYFFPVPYLLSQTRLKAFWDQKCFLVNLNSSQCWAELVFNKLLYWIVTGPNLCHTLSGDIPFSALTLVSHPGTFFQHQISIIPQPLCRDEFKKKKKQL